MRRLTDSQLRVATRDMTYEDLARAIVLRIGADAEDRAASDRVDLSRFRLTIEAGASLAQVNHDDNRVLVDLETPR